MQDNSLENNFEKFPGARAGEVSDEQKAEADRWATEMSEVEFAGNEFGTAKPANEFYGETVADAEAGEAHIDGAESATKIISLINGFAVRDGVGSAVEKLETLDLSGSKNPVADIYKHFGVDNSEEYKEVRDTNDALKPLYDGLNEGPNAPVSNNRSAEEIIAAVEDFKEIIREVKGADPRFAELRAEATVARMDYFDYAVSKFQTQDLTTLFKVLAEQREQKDENVQKNNEPIEEADGFSDGKIIEFSVARGARDEEAEKNAQEELERL